MRIGEILLRMNACGEDDLALALADQRIAGTRTCSLLIVRGALEPDQAARALAEQFGVAAALTRHLDNRDRALAKVLPANIARQHFALPIGKLRDGEIVICVRDPKPHLQGVFERIVNKPVLITVAAAHSLEPLIDETYAPVVTQEFGVRFSRPSTQPTTTLREDPLPPPPCTGLAVGTATGATSGAVAEEFDVDLESGAMTIPDELSLVSLDDAGVNKDFSQFSQTNLKTPTTLPPPNTTRTPAKKP